MVRTERNTPQEKDSMHDLAKNCNTTSNNDFTLNKTHLSVSTAGRAWATKIIHRATLDLFRYAILCNCGIDHVWRIARMTGDTWQHPNTAEYSRKVAHCEHVACISFISQHTKIYGLAAVSEEGRYVNQCMIDLYDDRVKYACCKVNVSRRSKFKKT